MPPATPGLSLTKAAWANDLYSPAQIISNIISLLSSFLSSSLPRALSRSIVLVAELAKALASTYTVAEPASDMCIRASQNLQVFFFFFFLLTFADCTVVCRLCCMASVGTQHLLLKTRVCRR